MGASANCILTIYTFYAIDVFLIMVIIFSLIFTIISQMEKL